MRPVTVSLALLMIASAQSPTALKLRGVWVLDTTTSRLGRPALPPPFAISLVPTRLGVKLIQISKAHPGHAVVVYDYTVEPDTRDGGNSLAGPSRSMSAFRARCKSDKCARSDEKWLLSDDGLRLVIERELAGAPQPEKQILYFARSDSGSALTTY